MSTSEHVVRPLEIGHEYRAKAKNKNQPIDTRNHVDHDNRYGSGGGGDDELEKRVSRIETIIEDIRDDLKEIKSEIQSSERRLTTKINDDNKWVISLIVSSILIPLLIALVTK